MSATEKEERGIQRRGETQRRQRGTAEEAEQACRQARQERRREAERLRATTENRETAITGKRTRHDKKGVYVALLHGVPALKKRVAV